MCVFDAFWTISANIDNVGFFTQNVHSDQTTKMDRIPNRTDTVFIKYDLIMTEKIIFYSIFWPHNEFDRISYAACITQTILLVCGWIYPRDIYLNSL